MALSTFPVADVLLKIAEQEGVNLSVEGIDDVCYGLVISSDKTFIGFLQEHALPYNWLFVDGDPIRVVRRAVGNSLVMDHSITQADCVPSGGAAVSFKRADEGNLPREIEIQYTDPDRQFATTTRSGRHLGAPFENPGRSISIDFLISATQARDMAFDTLYRIWSQQLTVSFEHRDITLEPGDTVLLSCDQGTYTLLVTEAVYTASRTTQVTATVLLASSGITISAGDWTNWPPAPPTSPDVPTSPDAGLPTSPHVGLLLQISAVFVGAGNLRADLSIDAPGIQQISEALHGAGTLIASGTLVSKLLQINASFSGSGLLAANGTLISQFIFETAAFYGVGNLAASNTGIISAISAPFTGAGQMIADARNTVLGELAEFHGAGTLSATGNLPPVFVNTGTLVGNASASNTATSSPSPDLPGSRVNGNLLIAWVQVTAQRTISLTSSPGWTLVSGPSDATGSCAIAWRYVDGTEAVPTFSWSGLATYHFQTQQFKGAAGSNPIGDVNTNSGTTTPLNVGALSTSPGSLALGLLFINGSNQVMNLPSGYLEITHFNDAFASDITCYERINTAGTSDAISTTITNANWQVMLVELKSS